MSPKKPDAPTPAEWKVLKILFDRGASAARDVIAEAERAHGWSASTVKTLLKRLVEKGQVKAKRIGNAFLYSAGRPAQSALREQADRLIESTGYGDLGALVMYLVKKSGMTQQEYTDMLAEVEAEAALEKKESKSRKRSRKEKGE